MWAALGNLPRQLLANGEQLPGEALPIDVSDTDLAATIRWLTPTVSTLSSGRAGDDEKMLPAISSDSYSGCFCAIASDTSIGRNFGSPRAVSGCRDCIRGDLAVQRTDRHEGVDRGILRHFAEIWLVPN